LAPHPAIIIIIIIITTTTTTTCQINIDRNARSTSHPAQHSTDFARSILQEIAPQFGNPEQSKPSAPTCLLITRYRLFAPPPTRTCCPVEGFAILRLCKWCRMKN